MKWLLPTFIALFVGMVFYTGYSNGKGDCNAAYAKKSLEATQNAITARDKVSREVIRSSDPDLDLRLNKWMRDSI